MGLSDFIIKVGCKRILTIMIVGTWSLSQLLRAGIVISGNPELAMQIGVSAEFSNLAYLTAGGYLGYSIHKEGTNHKEDK